MPVDRNTRKVKGYAVVTFLVPENAARAFMELDGSIFHGRMLHLLPGKAKESLEELMEKGKRKLNKKSLKELTMSTFFSMFPFVFIES